MPLDTSYSGYRNEITVASNKGQLTAINVGYEKDVEDFNKRLVEISAEQRALSVEKETIESLRLLSTPTITVLCAEKIGLIELGKVS